jgi:transcriptional regulator NrdR family protein
MSRHSILCPFCGREGQVYATRRVGDVRLRRRKCRTPGCDTRWKTTEGEPEAAHEVVRYEQVRPSMALGR